MLRARDAWGGLWDISFDQCEMALLLDEYVSKCGIDLLLHTMGSEPIVEEDSVLKGIYIQNKSGTQAVLADVVIDCTGTAISRHAPARPLKSDAKATGCSSL